MRGGAICREGSNRVVLSSRRPLPVHPDEQTFSVSVDMSQRCRSGLMRCSKPQPHSMTSSARASSVGGTVRPSVVAVLRLVANLYRSLHRQIGRLFALEDAIGVTSCAPMLVDQIRPPRTAS